MPSVRARWWEDGPVSEADLESRYASCFRDHFPRIARTVNLILRDPIRAEDITQDAFLELYRHWSTVSGYDHPDAWVRRVAIRRAVRVRRRDALWRAVLDLFQPSTTPPHPDPDIAAAIGSLPRVQRAAVVLHYYEGRPVAEIAELLGCAEPTARVHLHRARRRLAVLLREDDDASR
jgi:DNA-directed RNA polymerase specialized sigma24 family protein